jgi:serine/threonine protein kinase
MEDEKYGRYTIQQKLGQGGMGTVYIAHDPHLDREVALKLLPHALLHDPSFRKRFITEARLIAKIKHAAIVPIYDFGEDNGQPFMVMQLMTGGTLSNVLEKGPIPLHKIEAILNRLCAALDKAHSENVIHRDIKPANILFDANENAYLGDFGIARLTEGTQTMTIIGTPRYMAPEQAHGKALDARTDVYQLGVVLYEMLTGEAPFQASTPAALLMQHAFEMPRSPLEYNAQLPEPVDEIVRRALAKKRDERYTTAGALAAAFSSVEQKLSAQPLSHPSKTEVLKPKIEESPKMSVLEVTAHPRTENTDPPEIDDHDLDIWHTELDRQPTSIHAAEPLSNISETAVETFWKKIPVWSWVGGGILLLVFIGALIIQSEIFGADSDNVTTLANNSSNSGVIETSTNTPSPTGTSTNTAAATATATVTVSATATTTLTPTLDPTATITPSPDPRFPPSNAVVGTSWIRPSDGMTMIFVPSGTFLMGSDPDVDPETKPNESPQREISLDAFWIDQTEVTNAQFAEFLNSEGNSGDAPDIILNDGIFVVTEGVKNHPVVDINWDEADAYCKWAGGNLPTEAQWEYAARGNDGRLYPWGNEEPSCELTRFNGCGEGAAPVGSHSPAGDSWIGAQDMAGNVWEWTSSWYNRDYYAVAPSENPKGPETGENHAMRSGGWSSEPLRLRTAHRGAGVVPEGANNFIGFRCSFTPES